MLGWFDVVSSERQYKRRIKQWGLEKKVKTKEMGAIVRVQRKRFDEEGKETFFRVRKRPVDPKKITRFIRNHARMSNSAHSRWSYLTSVLSSVSMLTSVKATPSVISYYTVENRSHYAPCSEQHNPEACGPDFSAMSLVTNPDNISTQYQGEFSNPFIPEGQPSGFGMCHVSQPTGIENANLDLASYGISMLSKKTSTGNSMEIDDFFDFSAAAGSEVKSGPSVLQFASRNENTLVHSNRSRQNLQECTSETGSEGDVFDTLDSLLELAGRLEDQGKYEWSRMLLQKAVRLHGNRFGHNHPSPLDALEALSRILRRQGRYSEADRLLSGALRAFRRTRGERHAETLDCMGLLALAMMDQGRYIEAERMARNALVTREDMFEAHDVGVARSRERLGVVLAAQEHYSTAEELHREVITARARALGPNHPKTLYSMNCLALSLEGQGKYAETEILYREMTARQHRTLGMNHPHTLTSMHGIAIALGGQKRFEESEAVFRHVIHLRCSISGNEHPHTLTAMHNLAGNLKNQRRYEEALDLYNQVLEIERRTLGSDHPSTSTTEANMVPVLEHLGEDDKAFQLSQAALQSRQKTLGFEHPQTLTSKIQLARLLQDKGEYQHSLTVYCEVLCLRQKNLGSEHHLTASTLRSVKAVEQLIHDEEASVISDCESETDIHENSGYDDPNPNVSTPKTHHLDQKLLIESLRLLLFCIHTNS